MMGFSFGVMAGPGSTGIIDAVGNAGAKLIDAATGGAMVEGIADTINAATGGISSGEETSIKSSTKVGKIDVKANKKAVVDAQIGHVGGIKSKGKLMVDTTTRAKNVKIRASKDADVILKVGGVGK
ncbi:MAG TPA: hypothetical protein HPP65_12530 [Gammaproteobacteria bacterium]|jgi:hypothetical protein|nr:hypothetical protein [Gammaproteobacteria bacterium]MBT5467120.1 hypothetical protein [Candidatus Neomarinimicrobiota bacterium]MBT7479161.1 hypothetical protein [Gammaproteobacteria bacterium]MBT7831954.1 hypothetical protein [Candidatus Neomarinimicrobiota bacterium]HIJ35221.1 hypothetical protein [Gammaproteobacteria bacterium]